MTRKDSAHVTRGKQASAEWSSHAVPTRVTILVDNRVMPGSDLMPEHGFSALIERGPEVILFDTGQGPALRRNAATLGKDLSGLRCVVLSHGHYDHTGGLGHALELNRGVRVVSHPAVFAPHLKRNKSDSSLLSIGIPYLQRELEAGGAIFDFSGDFRAVGHGVWFTGEVPRSVAPPGASGLVTVRNLETVPDPLEDDASLVFNTPAGPCILLGCAHAGVRNILTHVCACLGIESIHAVVGGTHLLGADRAETYDAIEALEQRNVQVVAPMHCTGSEPNQILKAYFGGRYLDACAGMSLEF
jgi:7,8-dihydropterin-6-yl-methyl-4-(beta-D-ribofuranosyl)aminobenzene 5'-phosphate synthase